MTILEVLLGVAAALGATRTFFWFRGRAMIALAARLGFKYIGPSAPERWMDPPDGRTGPHLPSWVGNANPCGFAVRQVWNVMEGERNGMSILVFDAIYGSKGGQPFTAIVCQTERDPFQGVSTGDQVYQAHGWTVLRGIEILGFSWTMRVKRLGDRISNLDPQ
jgi:hypothetical protein